MEISKVFPHKPKLKKEKSNITKLLIGLIFVILVIIPLVRMLLYIDSDSVNRVLNNPTFPVALFNSFLVSLLATLITLVIAYLLAVCIERTNIRFKSIWNIILVLPMLIPSISHGMGLILLFGNNGVITKFLGLSSNIYGMKGIIVGSVMYAFPIAFLMISDILKYEDCTTYEAAKILGIPKWRQFTSITLPYLRKPLISVIFAVFAMIVTDYGVPLMVGGRFSTLPVIMYQEVIGQQEFGKGSFYGAILLIPAVVAFIFDILNKDKGNSSYVIHKFEYAKNKIVNSLSYIYCGFISLCTMLPIAAFVILGFTKRYPVNMSFTFDNILKAVNMDADQYLLNSVIIALLVSVIGITISFITAYLTARMKSKTSKLLHLIAITSAAIPGIVLGLSYIIVFKSSFFYGTIAILIMVNLIHFFASPYIMMYNSFNKINENLEAVGQTLGISRLRMIKDVFIPQSIATIAEMASYFFINCMMTISAVSFLATTSNKPIALMINQFEAQMQLECAAIVSLAILIVNILVKAVVYIVKRTTRKTQKV